MRSVGSSVGGLYDDDDETDQIVRQFDAYAKKTRLKMVERRRRLSGSERAAALVKAVTDRAPSPPDRGGAEGPEAEVSLTVPEHIQPDAPKIVQGEDGHWYEVYHEQVEVEEDEPPPPPTPAPDPPSTTLERSMISQERELEAAEAAEVVRQFGGKDAFLRRARQLFQ